MLRPEDFDVYPPHLDMIPSREPIPPPGTRRITDTMRVVDADLLAAQEEALAIARDATERLDAVCAGLAGSGHEHYLRLWITARLEVMIRREVPQGWSSAHVSEEG